MGRRRQRRRRGPGHGQAAVSGPQFVIVAVEIEQDCAEPTVAVNEPVDGVALCLDGRGRVLDPPQLYRYSPSRRARKHAAATAVAAFAGARPWSWSSSEAGGQRRVL